MSPSQTCRGAADVVVAMPLRTAIYDVCGGETKCEASKPLVVFCGCACARLVARALGGSDAD
jgi:hypothetical protein